MVLHKFKFNFWNNEFRGKSYLNFTELSLDLKEYRTNSSDSITAKLFPWLYYFQNSSNLTFYAGEKNSRGIVICTGNEHSGMALVAIKALHYLGSKLPIEVVYSNSKDLSLSNRKLFQTNHPNVRLIDLSTMAFKSNHVKLNGWQIKPYGVLASRFEQVLLIDADVLFFEKPEMLFEHKYFIQTGTLFFHDRPVVRQGIIKWIQTFSLNSNQTFPNRTQESGVVLLDKSRVLNALLAICKLNDYPERKQVTYQHLYGDKDTWWVGFHMSGMPYSFVPTMTASMGHITKRKNKTVICGHMLHYDENNTLIWWNGGMLRSRFLSKRILLQVDGWLEEGQWKIRHISCLRNEQQTPKKFNYRQQELIDQYRQITKQVFGI